MRNTMWFAVGFGLACALSANFLWGIPLLIPAAAFVLAGIAACISFRKQLILRSFAVVCIGSGIGFGWFAGYQAFYLHPMESYDGMTIQLTVTALDYDRQTRYSMSASGSTRIDGKTYRIIVYFQDDPDIQPGDTFSGDFRIRVTTPAGAKDSSYYQGSGIFLTASQKSDLIIDRPDQIPIRNRPAVFSNAIKQNLMNVFPEDTAFFAKAILLGDTDDIGYAEDTALKLSGIRHIVAVSGLHVSLVFGFLLFFLKGSRFLTLAVSTPVLFVFAAMTGFTPSVTRACIMTILMAMSWLLFEEYDGLTGLSIAAIIMLVQNPFVINSVSFQLSVSSVAGILLFSTPLNAHFWFYLPDVNRKSFRGRCLSWIGSTVCVSISATVFTVPLCAYYFGTVSVAGLLTNLLVLWAVGIIFVGTAIIGLLGGKLTILTKGIARVISWLIRYVLFTAKWIASFPFSAVYTESTFIVCWVVLCYLLLAVYCIIRKKKRLFLSVGVFSFLLAIALSISVPRLDDFRITVLDVGEGQSVLLQSKGKNILVDCGGDTDDATADRIAQTLLSQGIRHLDGIAITHFDRDHVGALENLMSRIKIKQFYLPDVQESGLQKVLSLVDTAKVTMIEENTVLPLGIGTLTLIRPDTLKTENENCMCILFESEKCDILITGDRSRSGEKRLLKQMVLPQVDILIGGHHGSKNSTSTELLEAVRPEIVIFSCGRYNSYGHPSQEVLDRLAEYHCTVYRTDQMGSVLVRR